MVTKVFKCCVLRVIEIFYVKLKLPRVVVFFFPTSAHLQLSQMLQKLFYT